MTNSSFHKSPLNKNTFAEATSPVAPYHYVLAEDGKTPVHEPDFDKFLEWHRTADCKVAYTDIQDIHVSTVFVWLDNGFDIEGKPLLFKTEAFGDIDDHFERVCATHEQALIQHKEVVELVRSQQ